MQQMPTRAPGTRQYFEATERLPSSIYYWLAMGSILGSAFFWLIGRRNWAIFMGQWVPTFLILPLFHRLLRPSQEEALHQIREAGREVKRATEHMTR